LGRSLGIDLVPFKTCTYDCVYCQLGRTTNKTIEQKEYVAVKKVLAELEQKLAVEDIPDYISLAALPGAVMTCFLLPLVQSLVPYLLSVSAASFIYIALADLVPGRRTTGGLRSLACELPLIALGIGTIVALRLSATR
jgi:hypothetical protein